MDDETPFPLFKGATRSVMYFGVPLVPLVFMVMTVASLGMSAHPGFFLLGLPAILVMRSITKSDDKAFRGWWLWFTTTVRNTAKGFWGSSSYSPTDYQKRK